MQAVIPLMLMFSVLTPTKQYYSPNQPLEIAVKAPQPVTLVLTDFTGKTLGATGSAEIPAESTVDLRRIFQSINTPGTYVLYAVPTGQPLANFLGTPLVIGVREDTRAGAAPGPLVLQVNPLCFATIRTSAGEMTFIFYYDAAPNTVENFLKLAQLGFYDGLTFHRIVPGFIIQGGDPLGNGQGGPGYSIDAEFSDRQHLEGVLSMARSTDPNERSGALPRADFANSAGSQFFICLDYNQTKALDRRYTAFGRIVQGMEVAQAMSKLPLADEKSGRPVEPPVIEQIRIQPVTAEHDPYSAMLNVGEQTTQPASAPTTQPVP